MVGRKLNVAMVSATREGREDAQTSDAPHCLPPSSRSLWGVRPRWVVCLEVEMAPKAKVGKAGNIPPRVELQVGAHLVGSLCPDVQIGTSFLTKVEVRCSLDFTWGLAV